MSKCISYIPTQAEEAAILVRLQSHLDYRPPAMAGGRCDACPKILEEDECAIRGYASGEELGLCRKCASFVNTPFAIEAAEKLGHEVKSKPVFAPKGSVQRVEDESYE